MRVLSPVSRLAGILALATVLIVLTSFWAVPAVMSRSTFASLVVFLLGGAAVTLVTWRNAQATSSTAQLLHDAEVAAEEHRRG